MVLLGLVACSEAIVDPSGGGAGAEPPASGGGDAAVPATGGGGPAEGGGGHGGDGGAELPVGQCSPPVEAQPFDKGILPLDLYSVAFDRSGNLGITGIAQTRIDLGGGELPPGGGMDVVVAKFDAAGNHVFSKVFGNQSDQRGDSIAFDSRCNLILGGTFAGAMDLGGATLTGSRSLFVAKLDGAGNHIWSKRLGGASALDPLFLHIAVDPMTDDVVLAGDFKGTIDFGGASLTNTSDGRRPAFVAKLNAAGKHLWSKQFVGTMSVDGLGVDASGDVLISGGQGGSVDFGGGPLGPDDPLALGLFLVRLDAAGNHRWSKRWESTNTVTRIKGMAIDANGDALIAGSTECGIDLGGGLLETDECRRSAFVAGFDAEGSHEFSRLLDSSEGSVAQSVGMDPSGNALIAGLFGGRMDIEGGELTTDAEGGAGFVVQLSKDGSVSRSRTVVGNLRQLHRLAVDPEGHVAVLGSTWESVELESGPQLGRGDFVTKFDMAAP
ncbi:hypothetical protein BE17_47425 [Sorangium cellulosum]|uniref:Uncharacterized protein n=1 Tax=Sorangium cellulosum TaxID=56 RepID=A0A150S1Y3_SORCE|nr:hypothetical protein BE17_47425 [Sorangium cellulosum]